MAVEYGPQQVRVNTILPALIETELAHTRVKPGEDWYEDYEKPAIAGCEWLYSLVLSSKTLATVQMILFA